MTKYAVFLSTGAVIHLDCDRFGLSGDKMAFYDGAGGQLGEFSRGAIIGWCRLSENRPPEKDHRKEALQ